MTPIESAQNATYKKFLSLTGAKGLKKEGLFLLSGKNLVREFLAKPHLKIHSEIVTGKLKPLTNGVDVVCLSAALFDEIDVIGTGFNILVLEQPLVSRLEAAELKDHGSLGIECVIPVGDPGNLGALLRSCEAFGIKRAILTEEAAHPFLPKTVKASAGSVLRLPLLRGPALREFPDKCIALDKDGTDIDIFPWPKNGMLVVGEEGPGLGAAQFKRRVTIKTQGVESLNAVVAASIALAFLQRAAK